MLSPHDQDVMPAQAGIKRLSTYRAIDRKDLKNIRVYLRSFADKTSLHPRIAAIYGEGEKKPGLKGRANNGTSLGMLIPSGPLREASEPAPGYSAFHP